MGIARAALRCDLVTTAGGLERLAEPWERLRAESPRSTPFQSPAWLIAWWNAFHPGALSTFAFHDGGRLLGVAPLFVQVRPRDGVRQLVPLGIGNTDYLDVVAAPGRGADVAAALWDALDDAGSEVGECDFPQLPPWSPLIAASEPARWSLVRGPGEPCPVVPLEGDADWPAVVPVGYRRRIRKYGRQSARVGAVAVQRAADGPEALALELMDEFIRLHAAAWAPRGQPGVLHEPAVQAFHREVARRAWAAGALDLCVLRIDGRAVAGYYGFRDGRRAYAYLGGYDPDFAKLDVITLLMSEVIWRARADGLAEYDFLRGREPYKYRWGARDRPTHRLVLTRG